MTRVQLALAALAAAAAALLVYLLCAATCGRRGGERGAPPTHPPMSLKLYFDPASGRVTMRGGTPLDLASFRREELDGGDITAQGTTLHRVVDGVSEWLRADLGTGELYVTTTPPAESAFAGEYGFLRARGGRLQPWHAYDLSVVPIGGVVDGVRDRENLADPAEGPRRITFAGRFNDVRFGGNPGGEFSDAVKWMTEWRFY